MSASKGIDFLVKLNTGTAEDPAYKVVGGQRGASLSRETETLDVTTKDSNGNTENIAGFKSWSIEADGLLTESDEGFLALEDAYDNGEAVLINLTTASGNKYEGNAIITSFPISASYDDVATYELSFTGTGELKKVNKA